MNSNATSIRIVDRVTNYIAVCHFSIHVEVDRVATNNPWLANLSEFCIFDPPD